ncbi:MAG: hypothetical protein ACRDLN_01970 [Solirubrobacteraceae bacterium]
MNGNTQHRSAALKVRVAGVLTSGAVVSLVLVPEALAKMASNHNETVLALD